MNTERLRTGQRTISRWLRILACLLLVILTTNTAQIQLSDIQDRILPFTSDLQFNFVGWTVNALSEKFAAASMGWPRILPAEETLSLVKQFSALQSRLDEVEQQLTVYYSTPDDQKDPQQFTEIKNTYDTLKAQQTLLEPVYESIVTEQIRSILKENQLTAGTQPVPPILFRETDLPYALIISPRDRIEQSVNISLLPDLPLTTFVELEKTIEKQLNVSALVVPVGGIGTYPTMIMRTTNFDYTVEVIQHEWIHNYLTLFPLGLNYETTPELRTINETTASIAGKELGSLLINKYYPPLNLQPVLVRKLVSTPVEITPPVFDFRAEMHTTRVAVDALLAEGKFEEAETYMENRRILFLENGYTIRRINQAYFAFYGAYADQPGGAAGDDPVGEAVRTLRKQKSTLAEFIKTIAWVDDYQKLLDLLKP
jgi:hypothetical protein